MDFNAFQNKNFFKTQIASQGYKLAAIGDIYISKYNVYSKKYNSVNDLPDGAKIAIPNNPANAGRAYDALARAGLITVSTKSGELYPTKDDVTGNPKHLDIEEVDPNEIPNLLEDYDIDRLFMSLYEDKSKGILTEHRFVVMTEQLGQEQAQGKTRTQEIMEALSRADDRSKDVRTFIEGIGQYAAIEELDEAVVHRLIDKIVIGQPTLRTVKKSSGSRSCTISSVKLRSKATSSMALLPNLGGRVILIKFLLFEHFL